jgi:hypothetical protein
MPKITKNKAQVKINDNLEIHICNLCNRQRNGGANIKGDFKNWEETYSPMKNLLNQFSMKQIKQK